MGTTNQTPSNGVGGDEKDVRAAVRDALDGHIVCDIHVNPDQQLVVAEFGRQYRWSTAQRVVRKEAAPAIPDEWMVCGFVSPSADVKTYLPGRFMSLTMLPVEGQQVATKDVPPNVLGVVAGGLEDYLNKRGFDSHNIPETYSNWDEGWDNDVVNDVGIIHGSVGLARNADEAYWCGWGIEYVEAAVRILSGKGGFNSDKYKFHSTVPLGVVEGRDGAVIFAPRVGDTSADDVDDPDFRYDVEDGDEIVKNIEFLGGGEP